MNVNPAVAETGRSACDLVQADDGTCGAETELANLPAGLQRAGFDAGVKGEVACECEMGDGD